MPPESHESTTSIIDESMRIKDDLLGRQEYLNAYGSMVGSGIFKLSREQLGYPEPENVELDGLVDRNITGKDLLISPESLERVLPITRVSAETTRQARADIEAILTGEDDRLLVVVGPCSIHDPEAALEYARFLSAMREQYGDDLVIVMRDYPEKPRTETGWKGFLHDPLLDGSGDMNLGLIADRMLALRITDMGVPIARERLGANTPQYVNGLVAYDSIGARNVEDQNARMYASGTSSPVGFKNATDGLIDSAVSACVAANASHSFVGLYANGQQAIVHTAGNPLAHVILRGSRNGPNFDETSVGQTVAAIAAKNAALGLAIPEAVVVDASHRNKIEGSQMDAIESVARQISGGSVAVLGVMIESNLRAGNQKLDPNHPEALERGVSITDTCVDLNETGVMLRLLSEAVQQRRKAPGQRQVVDKI